MVLSFAAIIISVILISIVCAAPVFTFGISIGTSIFKPATAIRLVLLSLFMAAGYIEKADVLAIKVYINYPY